MRLLLALGNPGAKYRDTRHNIGWWLADRLARRWGGGPFRVDGPTAWTTGAGQPEVEIHKPLAYMNRSGEALTALLDRGRFDPAADMLVLVDDIALPAGRFRVRARGSPGGHNGLASISASLGSDEYARLRLGVGRPRDERIDLAAWVLSRMPRAEEEEALGAFPRAAEAVEYWLDHGSEAAMNRFNRPG
ncbi:MAG: aminoacyl-tRNA hydrolase [Gemmatimonadales bacterium]|nr:aminoacyl-tRNA hydrolase [Gemmatimonadales bacterium]MYC89345.1 aminoacyl-tRNA hydrolase [Candidatus Palauibacter denitrificans]